MNHHGMDHLRTSPPPDDDHRRPTVAGTSTRRGVTGLWQSFAQALVTDAREERVSPRWAWRIFWTPIIGGVVVALTFAVRPVYYWLLVEDHVIEWLQFAFCALAAVAALAAAAALARRGRWFSAAVMLVMAAGCAGLAAEEISWAQRAFGFASVEGNRQGELNLHNVESEGGIPIERIFQLGEMVVGLIGAVLPLLTRRQPVRLRGEFWRMVSPPLFVVPGFLAVFGYRFARLFYPPAISAIVKYQEWVEVCLYGGLAIMAILIQVRVSSGAPGARETAPSDTRPPTAMFGDAAAGTPGPGAGMFGSTRPATLDAAASLDAAAGLSCSARLPVTGPIRVRRHTSAAVLQAADLRLMLIAAAAVAALTAVFAFLTMLSGIAPGNI